MFLNNKINSRSAETLLNKSIFVHTAQDKFYINLVSVIKNLSHLKNFKACFTVRVFQRILQGNKNSKFVKWKSTTFCLLLDESFPGWLGRLKNSFECYQRGNVYKFSDKKYILTTRTDYSKHWNDLRARPEVLCKCVHGRRSVMVYVAIFYKG